MPANPGLPRCPWCAQVCGIRYHAGLACGVRCACVQTFDMKLARVWTRGPHYAFDCPRGHVRGIFPPETRPAMFDPDQEERIPPALCHFPTPGAERAK